MNTPPAPFAPTGLVTSTAAFANAAAACAGSTRESMESVVNPIIARAFGLGAPMSEAF